MPRIRTIKPEFWTDEKLTECSLIARLLFIGLLNFADDNGNLVYSSKRLKMQIFPADTLEIAELLSELLAQGVLIEYSVSGERFLNIKGFTKHQVINRRSATKIPVMNPSEHSVSPPPLLTPGREGKGKGEEGKRKGKEKACALSRPESVSDDVWQDFLKLRSAKKAPLTATALSAIAREAEKAGITLEDCLVLCCSRGWQSFNSAWEWRGRTGQQSTGRRDPPNLRDAVQRAVDDVDTWGET